MPKLTMSKLARAAGVKPTTLRYYERRGLLAPPPRSPGGYRLYSGEAVERVRFIKRAQTLGFSLREIAELLNLGRDPGGSCAQVKRRAQAKISEIDEKIADLQKIRRHLATLSMRCRGEGPLDACPILEAMRNDEKEDANER